MPHCSPRRVGIPRRPCNACSARWGPSGELPPSLLGRAALNGEAIRPADLVPTKIRRDHLGIPNLSEHDVVRHFTRLSQMNFGIDTGFYPLGSCTMKFNPKFTEELAALPTVTRIHPDHDESTV